MRFVLVLLVLIINIYAQNRDFELFKKEAEEKSHTLLIIGGIHGDEPGGYFAPAIFERHYKITKGSVWVAPSVNIDSMIANTRGIYKDMNRKFSTISKNDPDRKNIEKIKKLITNKEVELVLNLHDGHGFYRKKYESSIFNPAAWGQATIIDQEKLHTLHKFGNLDEIASKVAQGLNSDKLFEDHHYFGVKNTETKAKDEQQQLSLTYFAITNNKPAFAIETSKNITDLTEKVVYQLKSIEEFLKIMDIEFERDFDLNNYQEVSNLLNDFGTLTINNNIKIDLNGINKYLRFVPLKKDKNEFVFSHTLAHATLKKGVYEISIGNKNITNLYPQNFELEDIKDKVKIEIDGKEKELDFASIFSVKDSFKVLKSPYRVNVIGFSKAGLESEDDILLKKSDMVKTYSIDKDKSQYRIEFYKDKKFVGMIIADFEE